MATIDSDLAAALARDALPRRTVRTGRKLWTGRTWAVTTFGLERHTGWPYQIPARRLAMRSFGKIDWPRQIAEKGDAGDFPDFAKAYVVAVRVHRAACEEPPTPDELAEAMGAAWAWHRLTLAGELRTLWGRATSDGPFRVRMVREPGDARPGFSFGPEGDGRGAEG